MYAQSRLEYTEASQVAAIAFTSATVSRQSLALEGSRLPSALLANASPPPKRYQRPSQCSRFQLQPWLALRMQRRGSCCQGRSSTRLATAMVGAVATPCCAAQAFTAHLSAQVTIQGKRSWRSRQRTLRARSGCRGFWTLRDSRLNKRLIQSHTPSAGHSQRFQRCLAPPRRPR